jgi:Flp pilus assembly protein TadG
MPAHGKDQGREEGYALLMVAFGMAVLMGFMALAIDIGMLFRAQRHLQTVADAAATAGALDYSNTASSTYAIAAAQSAATSNGVTDGSGGAVVTVNTPATGGYHTATGTVEVIATQPNPTQFLRALGINTMNITSRAVAGPIGAQGCVYIKDTLSAKGSATMEGWDTTTSSARTGCGVYAGGGVSVTGNGNTFNVSYVATSGSLSGNQNTNPAPVITGAPKQSIPRKLQITPPDPSSYSNCGPPAGYSLPTKGKDKGIITATLTGNVSPGCYGLGTTGATAMNLTLGGATTTMASGLYVFDLGSNGTLTLDNNVSGGSSPQGSAGVTLDVNSGNFAVTSTTNDHLYAPSDNSTYDGVLFLEPTSNTGTINFQWGSSSGDWDGYIVAPGATATMQDQGGAPLVSGLVLGNLTINGTLNLNNYGKKYTNSPMNSIGLVE